VAFLYVGKVSNFNSAVMNKKLFAGIHHLGHLWSIILVCLNKPQNDLSSNIRWHLIFVYLVVGLVFSLASIAEKIDFVSAISVLMLMFVVYWHKSGNYNFEFHQLILNEFSGLAVLLMK